MTKQVSRSSRSAWGGSNLPRLVVIALVMTSCAQATGNGDGAGSSSTDQDPVTTVTPLETTTPAPADTSTTAAAEVTDPSGDRIPEAPRFFTAATPSGSYTLTVGGSSILQLAPDTPQPTVEGTSVLVMDVASLTDPGTKQWELRAVEVGETTIGVETSEDSKTWNLIVGD